MALYKISIKLLSPLATPLAGDTIWGHIVWGIANHEGDGAVAKFLDTQKQKPELVVSSAFPEGYVCRPLPLPLTPNERKGTLNAENYTNIKKEKKCRLVKACDYLDGVPAPAVALESAPFETETTTHNTIDRETGTVVEGQLYSTEQSWARHNVFDLYAESSLPPERLETLFNWTFENGYGADTSIGKGRVEVVSKPVPVTPKHHTHTYMALGPFVNAGAEPALKNLRVDTFTRTGRLGGGFAGALSPYKKTVVLFAEGAVFDCAEPITCCGKLIENVHADPRICQSGFAPVIPIPETENKPL